MITAEMLTAAAKRIIACRAGNGEVYCGNIELAYGMTGRAARDAYERDAVWLAGAWFVANPEDSDLAVTTEWLREIGFTGSDGLMTLSISECELTTTTSSRWLLSNPSEIEGDSVFIPAPRTRGAVRRLLAVLG